MSMRIYALHVSMARAMASTQDAPDIGSSGKQLRAVKVLSVKSERCAFLSIESLRCRIRCHNAQAHASQRNGLANCKI
jgi:hypothetical protein